MENEIWKTVPVHEGQYEVSSLGRVRRGDRILRGKPLVGGHLQACFKHNKAGIYRLVHRVVLEAFVGPCPPGMECRHLDGNPANNRLDNLCWGTHAENEADKVKHGTLSWGDKHAEACGTKPSARRKYRKKRRKYAHDLENSQPK